MIKSMLRKMTSPAGAAVCLAVASLTFVLGIQAVKVLEQMASAAPSEIDSIKLSPFACSESVTSSDFAQFWSKFRTAVAANDRDSLFQLTRTCSFNWEVPHPDELLPVALELKDPDRPQPAPFLVNEFVVSSRSGIGLTFVTKEEFLANYDWIFSAQIRHKILDQDLTYISDEIRVISWADSYERNLAFELDKRTGYKFAGLEFVPSHNYGALPRNWRL